MEFNIGYKPKLSQIPSPTITYILS